DQLSADLREAHAHRGCVPICDAPPRAKVKVRGTIRTVTLRPRGGVPALEAEVDDGSEVLTLVWLGRRRIGGIGPGRAIEVQGRIGVQGATRVMFNPRYELRA
ncbi:MAG: OB-fold nucleic acid binding domain-containing protein, partial [Nocardioides sp.]